MTTDSGDYGTAVAVLNRLRRGWQVRRNGSGFLMWCRNLRWEQMTEAEAAVWHDAAAAEHIDVEVR